MELSIIIVNYNSPGFVIDSLMTIYAQQPSLAYEIIVVDNCSSDNSFEKITSSYPGVIWLAMGYNAGFARANNAGIRIAKGKLILLLNPDTLVQENAVNDCASRLAASSYIAAGVQLLNEDGSPQITGNFFIKGGLNQLMALPYAGKLIRWFGHLFKVKRTNLPKAEGTIEVDWINGAFLMVKREAIEKAGMLDEDFFLYFEEIEWCSRLRKTGSMCVYGDLHVVHIQGESAGKAFGKVVKGYYNLYNRQGLQILISGLLRIRKQYGVGWFLFHLLLYFLTIPFFLICWIVTLPFYRKYSFRQFCNYMANTIRAFALAPAIIRNKPRLYKFL